MDFLDDGRLQRLHHNIGQRVHEPPLRHHNALHLREGRPQDECQKCQRQHMGGRAQDPGQRRALDRIRVGEKLHRRRVLGFHKLGL